MGRLDVRRICADPLKRETISETAPRQRRAPASYAGPGTSGVSASGTSGPSLGKATVGPWGLVTKGSEWSAGVWKGPVKIGRAVLRKEAGYTLLVHLLGGKVRGGRTHQLGPFRTRTEVLAALSEWLELAAL